MNYPPTRTDDVVDDYSARRSRIPTAGSKLPTAPRHGAGKLTTKQIEERADVFAFLAHVLKMVV
jgi:hypothetical protein